MKRCESLAIGAMLVATIFFWQGNRPSRDRHSSTVESRSALAMSRAAARARPPATLVSELSLPGRRALHHPLDDTLELIREKLKQLSETKTADKDAQDELMTRLRALLTDENSPEISRALSSEELASPFGVAVLERWLKVDPAAAADWIATRPDVTDEQAWAVAHQLTEDLPALERYCDRLPDLAWAQVFLRNAGQELVWRDPVEAIHLAQRMDPGGARNNLFETVAYGWTVSNPGEARSWIMQVADPALKERLVCAGAKAQAATDPLRAAEWLVATVPSDELMNEALQSVIGIWVETKPAQVAGLVERFSVGESREAAVRTVSRRWLQLDSVSATAWIKTLPEAGQILAGDRID